MELSKHKNELEENGFSIIHGIYNTAEIDQLIHCIYSFFEKNLYEKKSTNKYSIRQLIKQIPQIEESILNDKFKNLLKTFGDDFFISKAIYFNKTKESNWFVNFHQDLSISVDKKAILKGYKNWTFKQNQYGVQPPDEILNKIITIRIHLDDVNEENGALKVIPKSHLKGALLKSSEEYLAFGSEVVCPVAKGGIMLMKPLTFHASSKNKTEKDRRVIHLEFCNTMLQKPLKWLEYKDIEY